MRESKIFPQRWMEVYWPIYLINQSIVLGKPVVFKDQRARRIKQSDIEVQSHIITNGEDYGQVSNFGDSAVWWTVKQAEGNWRSYKCFKMVSFYKFQVYKTMSRPRVNESLERDFIKVILTKDQERSKSDKKWMRIRKSGCIESDGTYCYSRKFNVALSLYRVLGVSLYFSKSFLGAVAEILQLLEVTIVCFLEQESNLWFSAP